MADQTQPWAERTVEVAPQPGVGVPPQRGPGAPPPHGAGMPPHGAGMPPQDSGPPSPGEAFRRGVASVGRPRAPRTESFPTVEHEPTGTGWPGGGGGQPRRPLSWHLEQLRVGAEWSAAGVLFAFVCWGIWAISGGGDLVGPLLTFLLSLLVAVGLFALSRLLGRVILERQLGRIRRSARGAHAATTVFLVGLGVAYLQQTEWVISAWNWITGT
ncbi:MULTISPECIES: hypothetical protein [Micromonospora]|uniref:Uncharacterized protein n=1 Tax=Micromonospora yangpuensis TaxID=683228 RepID=A0A1C6V591_9ACTN|nr:hypothetical protein [Micromonospora yangpuensis]GGM18365.1 hypothetical protein GCM10012279_40770 [Micromonospora yangpuensis]SCL61512.1 hypothetical protein GA0070617_4685 [Micromonospora yangpuensis]